MCFEVPWQKMSNMASPANLTIISRTASKFCAKYRAAPPEIFVLDLKSYESSGIIGPWPECQLTPTAAAATAAGQQHFLLEPRAHPGQGTNIPFGETPHSDIYMCVCIILLVIYPILN